MVILNRRSNPCLSILFFVNNFILSKVKEHGPQYRAFAIFGLINYILPFFMWNGDLLHSTLPLYLRSFASILCFLLLLKDHWPKTLQQFLPTYWYFTLLYCLPFLTSFLLLLNQGSTHWLMNLVLAIFLLVLLVDWISFILLLSLGISLALILDWLADDSIKLVLEMHNVHLALYMYFFSILIGLIFSRNKARINAERSSAIEGLSASIAHEIRTPLSSLRMNVELLRKYLPILLNSYDKLESKEHSNIIEDRYYKKLKKIPDDFESTIQESFLIIDMLLNNIKGLNDLRVSLKKISIRTSVEEALDTYPFKDNQRTSIITNLHSDFYSLGDSIMMRHIIYNLLKNALYYTNDKDEPKIEILTEQSNDANFLYVIDNGIGIMDSDLPYIFDPFYSKTKHGTGVGLSFCKTVMSRFDGNIFCESKYDEYTKFTLKFPKIKE